MCKIVYFSLIFAVAFSIALHAEDVSPDQDSVKRFCVSMSASYAGHPEAFSRTSIIGLGVTILHNEKIDIRNQLMFCNGVIVMEALDKSYFKKALSEKVSIGRMMREGLFRPYGFLEGRIGTSGIELYDFMKNSLIWNAGLGTGLDIYATDSWSWFLEFAFLGNFYEGEFLPQQRFELGFMFHF